MRAILRVVLPISVLGVIVYQLLFNEMAIYRRIKFQWVIVLFSIAAIGVSVLYIYMLNHSPNYYEDDFYRLWGIIGLVLTVILTAGMIVSMVIPKSVQTYSVSTAKDFKALENVPQINRYRILVKNDIDFNGEKVSLNRKFKNDIKGGGHTFSNFQVKNGIFKSVSGNISDLHFSDVQVQYYKEYEDKNKTRSEGELVLCLEKEGVLTNVTVQNCEVKYVYNNDGNTGGYIGMTLFFGFWIVMAGLGIYSKITE